MKSKHDDRDMERHNERERRRASTIEAYLAMLRSALATAAEKKRTGEMTFLIKFSDGGFHGHVLRVTEELRSLDTEKET